jgi:SAM-dependent methyltransferase
MLRHYCAPAVSVRGWQPIAGSETGAARMTESKIANTAQHEYWNTVAGPRWVGLDGFVEQRIGAVNDLLLARSGLRTGESVIEIGCGTGAATVPFAEAVGPQGRVVGVDISEPMLAAARRRIAESGLGNISLMRADAQVHSFERDRFDLIASRFGVMFFADPIAAFANLLPAARPGGRLCFVCWGPLEQNEQWLIPYKIAERHLGPPEPKPAHAPGPLAFSDPAYVRSILDKAGFAKVEIHRETPDIQSTTPEQEAAHALIIGPVARLIDEKNPDQAVRETIKQEMTEAFSSYVRGNSMPLPSTVFIVTARCR